MAEEFFIQGNEACAKGAIAAGCRFFAGYPITPSTEIAEKMSELLPKHGGTFIQMEDEISCCAALLHDVVEDTEVTLEDLQKEFPAEVVEAVRLLTHEEGVTTQEYLTAIKENPIALKVKLADNAHNADQTRCCGTEVSEEKKAYWRVKYATARSILLGETT